MISLRVPYPTIQHGAALSYGGSQMWAESETIRKCGCGPVAAYDLLMYMTGRQQQRSSVPLDVSDYNRELAQLCRKVFPLIPPFGINGLMLVAGLNYLFKKNALPYHARWMFTGKRLWDRVEEMLQQDIPVILAVGPNFPLVWGKHTVSFYARKRDGSYFPSSAAKAHYVTVTGMDETWLRISSWGQCYYIRKDEYTQYNKEYSTYLFSNIVYIKRI